MEKLLFLVLFLIKGLVFFGQEYSSRRSPSLSFGLQATQPFGEFSDYYKKIPFGFSGNLSIPIRHSAFEFGGLFAWNNMDSNDREVTAVVGTDHHGQDIYDYGTMRVRTNTQRYHLFTRLRPFTGKIQPYGELFTGLQNYSTKTDIQIDNSGYSSVSDTHVSHRSLALNVGWAAGLRIRLAKSFFAEGRFEKINGGKATYIDSESISVKPRGDDIEFDTRASKTNQYTYQLGLVLQF